MIAVQKDTIKSIYCEFTDFNINKCDDWVRENVIRKLHLKERFDGWNSDIALFKYFKTKSHFNIKAETNAICRYLKDWLSQFEDVEFWADYDTIDKPMLIDLIADWNKVRDDSLENDIYKHCETIVTNLDLVNYETVTRTFIEAYPIKTKYRKFNKVGLPKHLPNIRYDQFFDLNTVFKMKGIDTDINREEYSEIREEVIPLPFSNYDKVHNALYDAYVSYLCYKKLSNYNKKLEE